MNVISFPLSSRPAPPPSVLALAHEAARHLGRHAGLPVAVHVVSGVPTARVSTDYRLSVSVGDYSSLRKRPLDLDLVEWRQLQAAAPREIVVEAVAAIEWLKDGTLATEGRFGAEHAAEEFKDVEGAVRWVRKNCLPAPVERVSAGELRRWLETVVRVRVAEGEEAGIMLRDAVSKFGSLYGRDIDVGKLVSWHRMSEADALEVEAAIRKILPGRRT